MAVELNCPSSKPLIHSFSFPVCNVDAITMDGFVFPLLRCIVTHFFAFGCVVSFETTGLRCVLSVGKPIAEHATALRYLCRSLR